MMQVSRVNTGLLWPSEINLVAAVFCCHLGKPLTLKCQISLMRTTWAHLPQVAPLAGFCG